MAVCSYYPGRHAPTCPNIVQHFAGLFLQVVISVGRVWRDYTALNEFKNIFRSADGRSLSVRLHIVLLAAINGGCWQHLQVNQTKVKK
jgi:hypothetical protein